MQKGDWLSKSSCILQHWIALAHEMWQINWLLHFSLYKTRLNLPHSKWINLPHQVNKFLITWNNKFGTWHVDQTCHERQSNHTLLITTERICSISVVTVIWDNIPIIQKITTYFENPSFGGRNFHGQNPRLSLTSIISNVVGYQKMAPPPSDLASVRNGGGWINLPSGSTYPTLP